MRWCVDILKDARILCRHSEECRCVRCNDVFRARVIIERLESSEMLAPKQHRMPASPFVNRCNDRLVRVLVKSCE